MVREADKSSAVTRYLYPESHGWGESEELLASILDVLQGANWQRSGGRGARPTPVKRPWQNGSAIESRGTANSKSSDSMFGEGFEMDSVSLEEMNQWLGMSAT